MKNSNVKNLKEIEENYVYIKQSEMSAMTEVHYHRHYEIYYLVSEKQTYFIDKSSYNIKQGSFVVIRPGTVHKTAYGIPTTRIIINFNEIFLRKYLTSRARKILLTFFDKAVIIPDTDNTKNALTILEKISKAVAERQDDEVFFQLCNLFNILNSSPAVSAPDKKKTSPILDLILNYIEDNFSTLENLDEISENIKVSKFYICKLFSSNLGTTFINYLTMIRLKKAEELLESKHKYDINEIASSCGFNSPSYFCCLFRKKHGLSPLKYRELITKSRNRDD